MTKDEIKRAGELSASVAALGGHRYVVAKVPRDKKKQYTSLLPDFLQKGKVNKKTEPAFTQQQRTLIPERKTPTFVIPSPPIPETEVVYESAETIANKLNTLADALGLHVLQGFPKTEDIVPLVIEAIKNLKGNDRIDISHIRNGEQLSRIAQKVDMNDMRWHGSGGSSGSATHFSINEVVAGSGTTFTLANTPTAGTQAIYAIGQRLTLTVDYTIAGKIITTVNSWNAGDIIADYQY